MEILEKYQKEVIQDVQLDQLNILDKQLQLPTIKHKWVSRLIETKKELNFLKSKKSKTKKMVMDSLYEDKIKKIPKIGLDFKIENSEKFQEISKKIEDLEILVEYLEKVEKIFTDMNFSIKNSVDLMKMETS